MKKINYLIRFIGVTILLVSILATANATAVRPGILSRNAAGQIMGGFIDPGGPGATRVHLGSTFSDVSEDGNIVVFTTTNGISEFIPDAINSGTGAVIQNVLVRDVRTGEMTCMSCGVFFGGYRGWGGATPRITPDGRYVVFFGPKLDEAFSARFHVYRVDLQTGVKEVVSVTPSGVVGNNNSQWPVISDNGRYVAWFSHATDLIQGGSTGSSSYQVFVRDMQMGQTFMASHAFNDNSMPGNGVVEHAFPLSISANGRFTVWTSTSSNHSAFTSDTNNARDVFFFDVLSSANNIAVASIASNGSSTSNGASFGGIIRRGAGSFPPQIVFTSTGTNLDPADTNPANDVYLFSGNASLVSKSRDGGASNGATGQYATITPNGRYIAFTSTAANLVTGIEEPNNTTSDAFLRDMQTGTTEYISLSHANTPSTTATGASLPRAEPTNGGGPNMFLNRSISDDGRYVSFVTAEPLSVRDSGSTIDTYVRDRATGLSILATLNSGLSGGQNGNATTLSDCAFALGGRKLFFSSYATNLAPNDGSTTQNAKAYMADISLLASRSLTDIDGNAKNDFTVFRPSEGAWYSLYDPAGGNFDSVFFGQNGDRVAPGDYDGDGKSDYAVFNPSSGRWDILYSSTQKLVTRFFGTASDILVPSDYDGDGKTDIAYFRPSNGSWNILQSNTNSLRTVRFGLGTDLPVQGDYDGDNRADIAVFRPSTGDWWIQRSTNNSFYMVHWGLGTDKPVQGDYDGDGKTDTAVFRNGDWYISNSRDNSFRAFHWGLGSDKPVPADYDADGKTDVAVYRASVAGWYVFQSTDNSFLAATWGTTGDIPVTGAYVP